MDTATTKSDKNDDRPECQYGSKCYRRNPDHFAQFRHPDNHAIARQHTKRSHSPQPDDQSSKSTTSNSIAAVKSDDKETSSKSPESKKVRLTDSKDQEPSSSSSTSAGASSSSAVGESKVEEGATGYYHLSSVRGIEKKWNEPDMAVDIQGILSMDADSLVSSIQFNYMIDVQWLIKKYPPSTHNRPILLVTAARNPAEKAAILSQVLTANEQHKTSITLALAALPIAYGTHHTKMMILKYKTGVRVVIHTANLIEEDWDQKTQGVFITPMLPKMDSTSKAASQLDTFKNEFLEYLRAYKLPDLNKVAQELESYDMSGVRAKLIGSVPGRFQHSEMSKWGHGKLRAHLNRHVPGNVVQHDWPVVAQFSSIGSLGATADQWLMKEFRESLTSTVGRTTMQKPELKLIFPTVENVRTSLQGYTAGGSLPYQKANADKQKYLKQYFHQWKSDSRGRTRASPHIKTYFRISPCAKKLAWFLLTSANLSKAAWGAYEKNGSQLMIRSYELGVLFLPKDYGKDHFDVAQQDETFDSGRNPESFPLPYDLPLVPYGKEDEPWVTDIPYRSKRDSHGRFWP